MARFAFESPLDTHPVVLDMVDVDSAKWDLLAKGSREPLRWIYRREARTLRPFEAAAVARAKVTFVINDRERLAMESIAPGARVVVLPSGIDPDPFRPPDPPVSTPTVIFCGVMNYEPNERGVSWFAAEVWPRVRSVIPEARFSIVGISPTRAVKNLAARDPSIDVVGSVPSVQPYLWKSAVSVAPLHLAHGLQNKVLEALAAGLPVVVTPAVLHGLPPEAHRGCITAGEPERFAEAVIELLKLSPRERRQRATAASLDDLGWTERFRNLEALLRRAVSND
jgi:glycosyltransferase involved in cell wall biosynthesis